MVTCLLAPCPCLRLHTLSGEHWPGRVDVCVCKLQRVYGNDVKCLVGVLCAGVTHRRLRNQRRHLRLQALHSLGLPLGRLGARVVGDAVTCDVWFLAGWRKWRIRTCFKTRISKTDLDERKWFALDL